VADAALTRGVTTLVATNGRVRAGERVVVVTDAAMRRYAELVRGSAEQRGAAVSVCEIPPRRHDGEEPTAEAAALMLTADVIFTPVTRSITHTRAMRAALGRGARAVLMTAHDDSILTSPALPATDFLAQAALCQRLGAALAAGRSVRLTSPRGTSHYDLLLWGPTVAVDGRVVLRRGEVTA
jgi:leucyl aminopeptidase (aminopeptidase T)